MLSILEFLDKNADVVHLIPPGDNGLVDPCILQCSF